MEPVHEPASLLPANIVTRQVPDEALAQAYDASHEADRALLKLCIARLYALYRPARLTRTEISTTFDEGFACTVREQPLAWAVVLAGTGVSSAKLLAACLPPLCAGVRDIWVVLPDDFDALALTGLELAGIEQILTLSRPEIEELISHLAGIPAPGMLLDLDGGSCPDSWPHGHWTPSPQGRQAAKFAVTGDLDAERQAELQERLNLLHPGCRVRHGQAGPGDTVIGQNAGAAAGLTTDTQHAGVWVWPELTPEIFRKRSLRLESAT